MTVNYGKAQRITDDLAGPGILGAPQTATVTVTNTSGARVFQSFAVPVQSGAVSFEAEANTIYSTVLEGVTL